MLHNKMLKIHMTNIPWSLGGVANLDLMGDMPKTIHEQTCIDLYRLPKTHNGAHKLSPQECSSKSNVHYEPR